MSFEVALHAGGYFRRKMFKKDVILVGSAAGNDLQLRHVHVSRQHARITWKEGFYVEDLGSKNGTFVNGTRVEGTVALRSIDDIDIGPFTLTLVPLNPLEDGTDMPDVEARPAHPIEEKFLAAMRLKPGDPGPRVIYAEWLDGQNESLKADILRKQEDLRGFRVSPAQFAEVNALLAKLPQEDTSWRVLVARTPIECCAPTFAVRCPRTWDALTPTDKTNTRSCSVCKNNVTYAVTIDEARGLAQKGGRVVMDAEIKRTPNDLSPRRK